MATCGYAASLSNYYIWRETFVKIYMLMLSSLQSRLKEPTYATIIPMSSLAQRPFVIQRLTGSGRVRVA